MMLRRSLIILIALVLPATALAAKKYVVKSGDNLYDLSIKFGVSVDELKSINNLKNDRLNIGDQLTIGESANKKDDKDNSTASSNNNEYFVKHGDTLGEIADKYSVSIDSLQKANGLKTTKLQIGQKLLIPQPNSVSVQVNATKAPSIAASDAGSASVKPEPADRTSATPTEYTVRKGDTLGHIAVKFNISGVKIKNANGLKNDSLQIGQVLRIPISNRISAVTQAPSKKGISKDTSPQKKDGYYVVGKGDTPGEIAGKLGVRTDELIKLNSLNSKNLQIGQKLIIPGYKPQTIARGTKETAAAESNNNIQVAKDLEHKEPGKTRQTEYIVQKGDTPSEIAEKLGVRTDELGSLNNLSGKTLHIGQKLVVPGSHEEIGKEAASLDTDKGDTKHNHAAVKTETQKEIPSDYIVKNGDTLYDLANKYGTSIDSIKKSNNLKNYNLSIGQKLVFNGRAAPPTDKDFGQTKNQDMQSDSTAAKTTAEKYNQCYTVRKGDTLGHLAIKFGISQSELKNANGLKNSNLRIGQVLTVPGTVPAQKTEQIVARESAPAATSEKYIKKRYVVKAGDTLSGIASNFGVTAGEIKKASALKNAVINKGDILLIPVPQEKVARSNYKYTVVAGDSLGKISKKFNVPVKELKEINRLTSNHIHKGMKLNIPGRYYPLSSDDTSEAAAGVLSPRGEYVAKKGDSLGRIARRFGVTIKELKKENNIKGNTVNPGKVIYIPGYEHRGTEYMAVTKTERIKDSNSNSINANGQPQNSETDSKNGKFSKESIIEVAKKYLGAPYKFGGYDLATGIDCSGYVKKIFSRFNVYLPRTARDIYYTSGSTISKSNLDNGDLVFFHTYARYPSHVGIYIGNDEFIHASSASRMVTIDSLNKQYYRARYIGAKRIQMSGLFYSELSKDYAGFKN
ncbi:MAG: LysM peptidoglycan-binding domain-containing protein [Thermodesulfobacteriota bacterium]